MLFRSEKVEKWVPRTFKVIGLRVDTDDLCQMVSKDEYVDEEGKPHPPATSGVELKASLFKEQHDLDNEPFDLIHFVSKCGRRIKKCCSKKVAPLTEGVDADDGEKLEGVKFRALCVEVGADGQPIDHDGKALTHPGPPDAHGCKIAEGVDPTGTCWAPDFSVKGWRKHPPKLELGEPDEPEADKEYRKLLENFAINELEIGITASRLGISVNNDRFWCLDSASGNRFTNVLGAKLTERFAKHVDRGTVMQWSLWLLGVYKFFTFFIGIVALMVDASGVTTRAAILLVSKPIAARAVLKEFAGYYKSMSKSVVMIKLAKEIGKIPGISMPNDLGEMMPGMFHGKKWEDLNPAQKKKATDKQVKYTEKLDAISAVTDEDAIAKRKTFAAKRAELAKFTEEAIKTAKDPAAAKEAAAKAKKEVEDAKAGLLEAKKKAIEKKGVAKKAASVAKGSNKDTDEAKKNGWLLDGMPRTKAQCDALETMGLVPNLFLRLDVPDDVMMERACGRRQDPVTRQIYHIKYKKAPTEEIEKRLIIRSDDTVEKMTNRIAQYHKNMSAVSGSYTEKLVVVDGNRKPTDVFPVVCDAVSSARESRRTAPHPHTHTQACSRRAPARSSRAARPTACTSTRSRRRMP